MRNGSRAARAIRAGSLVVATGLATLAFARVAAGAGGLDGLGWLVGSWKRESASGSAFREVWTRLGDGILLGRSTGQRTGTGSVPVSLEDLLLVEMGGEVFFIAKPAENPYPVAFRMVSLEGRSVAFENPRHDFPQRITYELREDGTLLATAEGPSEEDGSPRRLEFRYARD